MSFIVFSFTFAVKCTIMMLQPGGGELEKEKLERISELTRISRERELSEQEQQERQALRTEYLQEMRLSLQIQLDHTVVVDPQGNRRKLKRR